MTEGSDKRLGDVTKLWLTTPTYNVYALQSIPASIHVMPREGMPGDRVSSMAQYGEYPDSLFDLVRDWLADKVDGERFVSGVIEFDTEDQIRFDVDFACRPQESGECVESLRWCNWKIRGSTYGGRWEDAADVDDATLIHRAIVAYQTWRGEAKERGE